VRSFPRRPFGSSGPSPAPPKGAAGPPVGAIVGSANETVTCTFFNGKKGGIIIKKATAGDVGTFTFTGTVPGSITTTSTNGQPSGPVLSTNVSPGTYAVAETPVAGWDTTSSCSDGSTGNAFAVAANEKVTCPFVNTKRGTTILRKTSAGHPALMMVTGPGGYKGKDFLRVGAPLTVLMLVATLLMVNLMFR